MKAERKRHFAVDRLSPRGRRIVEEGLARNQTYQAILDELKAETGEKLPLSSLQRYHARKWFPTRQVLEETDRLHGLVREALEKSQGKKLDEVSSELLKTHLFNALAAVQNPDPLKLYSLVISQGWLDVEKQKVGVQKERLGVMRERLKQLERSLELKERQVERMKQKEERAKEQLAKLAKGQMDAETIRKLRETYGLA